MAKKMNEEGVSGNGTGKDDVIIDDFVVQQPSQLGLRSTNDSIVITRKLTLLEAPDVLVDEEYGVEEDIYEDNDGNEKKKVKFK